MMRNFIINQCNLKTKRILSQQIISERFITNSVHCAELFSGSGFYHPMPLDTTNDNGFPWLIFMGIFNGHWFPPYYTTIRKCDSKIQKKKKFFFHFQLALFAILCD